MAFETLTFTDSTSQHFYYFVDRFTVSTKKDLYDAVFFVPTDDEEEEPKVTLDIPEDLVLFRFKVHVENYGTFMFFFERDSFNKSKEAFIEKVKKLRNIQNNDILKVEKLLNAVCKMKPELVGFYDEREDDIPFAELRKPFLKEHIKCKVIIFRKIDLAEEFAKAKKENSFVSDIKMVARGTKKAAHGVKVGAIAFAKACKWLWNKVLKPTGRGIKKATFATGRFFKRCGLAIASVACAGGRGFVWFYFRALKPVFYCVAVACVFIGRGLKKVFVPVGKFIGKYTSKFFRWIGRGMKKAFPRLLPALGRFFKKVGHGIKVCAIKFWAGLKRFGIILGGFFKSVGIALWHFMKWAGKWIWIGLKALGRLCWKGLKIAGKYLWIFLKWLGRKLKVLFIHIAHGIRHLPNYLQWKSDYSFYVIFTILFAFALLCGNVWALNGDGLAVFFYVMTGLFLLICVYATYIERKDHKDWKITAKNTVSPNLAVFLGLTAGIISSYFTAKAIVKIPEGKTIDFGLALWITIGASAFLLIILNFTPFIIHKVKENQAAKEKAEKQKQPAKTEQKPEIAGENNETISEEEKQE